MNAPATTEPTTFAELEAAGWVSYPAAAHPWLDTRIGDIEVTVYREGYVYLATNDAAEPFSEADACRLAARLAAVLRDFVPTT